MRTLFNMDILFSAVGILQGDIEQTQDNKLGIKIGDKSYPLFPTPRYRKSWDTLKGEISHLGVVSKKLLVYPKCIYFSDHKKPYRISFNIVCHHTEESGKGIFTSFNPCEFQLFGLWKFISPYPTPVISVFKNYSDERYAKFKDLEPQLKAKYARGLHLPLLWKDALVPPFRFDPQDKQQKKEIYFVGLKAKFNSQQDVFEFDSLLVPPTLEHPRHFRYKINQEKKASTKSKKGKKDKSKSSEENTSNQENAPKQENNNPKIEKPSTTNDTKISEQFDNSHLDMPVSGKLEVTIKINEFPDDVQTLENGWKSFQVECDAQVVKVTVKPKMFKKLEHARDNYPMWVAAIAGKIGEKQPNGFILDSPSIQAFERKPKEPKQPKQSEAVAAQ